MQAPDSPEHEALRAAARARAAATYSWPAIADQYEALLISLPDRRGHRHPAGRAR